MNTYIKIPIRRLLDARVCKLSGVELRVYLLFLCWADKEQRVKVSAGQLSGLLEHHPRTIRRAVASMVAASLITQQRQIGPDGSDQANAYTILPLSGAP